MPVQTPHSEHVANFQKWQRLRHVISGEDAVKDAGTIYLPKLEGQDIDDYNAYKQRAQFFNATSRTVDSFVGMIFRKDPEIESPDSLKAIIEDANLQGQTLFDYQKFIVREVISVGRTGTLIDWSEIEARAYVANYTTEQILNWRMMRVNGRTVLGLVVLEEKVEEQEALRAVKTKQVQTSDQSKDSPGQASEVPAGLIDHHTYSGPAVDVGNAAPDLYSPKMITQIRVLKLASTNGTDFFYTVELWHQPDKSKDYQLVLSVVPTRKGKPLPSIPFVFHGPNNLLPIVDKPPMDDIACVNLSHYRSSADLEHGRHYTGLPTPFISGVDPKSKITIGSATAICASDPQARATFLEFKGEGLKSLKEALDDKEHHMAVLGARMLEVPKRAAETVDVMQMKQSGEQSSLAQIATTCGESFTLILRWSLWWDGSADSDFEATKDQVSVELNIDFNPTTMDPAMVTAIVSANQAGLLSRDSCVSAFKRGELVSPLRSVEEELDLIKTEPPPINGNPLPTDKRPAPAPAK